MGPGAGRQIGGGIRRTIVANEEVQLAVRVDGKPIAVRPTGRRTLAENRTPGSCRGVTVEPGLDSDRAAGVERRRIRYRRGDVPAIHPQRTVGNARTGIEWRS